MKEFLIVGAGLAGCECALVLADLGLKVRLYEQKPGCRSAAQASDNLAELVCSNSLRSNERTSAIGLLKEEMRQLGSHFMQIADEARIPAGKALAVDREIFSAMFTERVTRHSNIELIEKKVEKLSELPHGESARLILAAGPMADEALLEDLARLAGRENCFFYDAIAPIIWTDSIDMKVAFRGSRYEDGPGDYLNCPMTREEYENFYETLLTGETWKPEHGDEEKHFEGCMPIEALAARGERTLVFGPMKPVGFIDPRTGKRPWAILQLRPESANMETCNLVGCQTKLLQKEQERIFRLVPGLERAEFVRFGSMHRNAYVNSPAALAEDLSLLKDPFCHVIGQLGGVEGYVESAATGLWLALILAAREKGLELAQPPRETALGSLLAHLRRGTKDFQPSNATFGLMPAQAEKIRKKERKEKYAERAERYFHSWRENLPGELLARNFVK